MKTARTTLLTLLAGLGLVCGTALQAGAGTPAGRAEAARLLPPDTVLLLHADLAALRGSPLYQKLTEPLDPEALLQDPLVPALFDLERDVDAVTLGMGSDLRSLYVVLRGRFP